MGTGRKIHAPDAEMQASEHLFSIFNFHPTQMFDLRANCSVYCTRLWRATKKQQQKEFMYVSYQNSFKENGTPVKGISPVCTLYEVEIKPSKFRLQGELDMLHAALLFP